VNPWKVRLRKATAPVLQSYFQDLGAQVQDLGAQVQDLKAQVESQPGRLQDQVRDQLNDHLEGFRALLGTQLQDQVRDQLNSHLEEFRAQLGLQLQDQARDQLNSHLEGFRALLGTQLQDQLRDQINDHLEEFRAQLGLQLQDQARDQLNSHLEEFRAQLGLQLQDQLRDQINDHLEGFRALLGLQLQDQLRDQLNDHLDGFLSRLQGHVADSVADRLSPRLGSVDAEVASLRNSTDETSSLTGALRDDVASLQSDVVELTRMLRMQADAADQVAEALGRTLIRLSVEVEDLNAALGGSPARGAELWPALSVEDEAHEAQEEARVVSLGLWSDRAEGWPASNDDVQAEGPGTGPEETRAEGSRDRAGTSLGTEPSEPVPASGTAGPGRRKATRRSGGRSRAEPRGTATADNQGEVRHRPEAKAHGGPPAGPVVEGNGARVPAVEEAPSPE
jgi:uncharacterized protein (DUF2267 family)